MAKSIAMGRTIISNNSQFIILRFVAVSYRTKLVLFSATISLLLLGIYMWLEHPPIAADGNVSLSWQQVSQLARDEPLPRHWENQNVSGFNDKDCEWVRGRQWPPIDQNDEVTLSMILHLARLPADNVTFRHPRSGQPLAIEDVLFDEEFGRLVLGAPPMKLTDYGVRYPGVDTYVRHKSEWRSGESHRDQVLGAMAEIGVSLSTTISVADQHKQVRDVLADSIAQFHLSQSELAWSAQAYAHYLPPIASWTNRYGESFSFDQLANELLSRPLDNGSCSGMHIIAALSSIYNVSCAQSVISADTHMRIKTRLDEWLVMIIAHQGSDGSWQRQWWRGKPVTYTRLESYARSSDIVATSHIVEWLFSLPTDKFSIPSATIEQSTRWLLSQAKAASDDVLEKDYCAYSHTFFVLSRIARLSKRKEVAWLK